MKKTTAILFAALLAIVPLSAQATAERPIISISSYEEWLAAGVDSGWVVNGQIVPKSVEQLEPAIEPVITEEVTRAPEKAIVIIDSYFDSSKISGDVVNVCIARVGCELTPNSIAGVGSAFNHGTAMAYLARKANPDAKLVLIRAASATKHPRSGVVRLAVINGNDFLNGLRWASSNKDSVSAVSFSYQINGNMKKIGDCRLSNVGLVNVAVVDPQIRSTISELKNSGVPVFASTGNDRNRKPVAYPACIPDVMSVAAGMGNSFLPSSNHDASTDYVGSLPVGVYSYTSSVFNLIPHATSSATVSVAALWSKGLVTDKTVRLSR